MGETTVLCHSVYCRKFANKKELGITSEDTHTKKSQKTPFGFKWRLLAFACDPAGIGLAPHPQTLP